MLPLVYELRSIHRTRVGQSIIKTERPYRRRRSQCRFWGSAPKLEILLILNINQRMCWRCFSRISPGLSLCMLVVPTRHMKSVLLLTPSRTFSITFATLSTRAPRKQYHLCWERLPAQESSNWPQMMESPTTLSRVPSPPRHPNPERDFVSLWVTKFYF